MAKKDQRVKGEMATPNNSQQRPCPRWTEGGGKIKSNKFPKSKNVGSEGKREPTRGAREAFIKKKWSSFSGKTSQKKKKSKRKPEKRKKQRQQRSI